MDRNIFDYLESHHGVRASREYYAHVEEWHDWMRGLHKPFHEFSENGAGGFPVKRELFRLNMAKKICEDWASLIFNERTFVQSTDNATSIWLTGQDGLHGFLEESGLFARLGTFTEKVFGLGTGAAILRIDGAVTEDGYLRPSPCATLRVDLVDARHIIPISYDGVKVSEAAFVSEVVKDGERMVYLELHRLERDGYVITNEWLRYVDGGFECCDGRDGVASVIRTGSPVPFFAVMTPAVSNHIDDCCGMGVSVFAQATDCLKGVDLAFNNFCRDLKLGGKKVFMNRTLVVRDDNGYCYTPDDVAQQLFVTVGDGDIDGETMIKEHNPSLRTAENAEAVQSQLDYLSFRCGLGTRHYLFSGVQGKAQLTATQYTGERQDLIQNTARHRANAYTFIKGIVKCALWAAKNVLLLPVDTDAEVSVRFDDSYFIDSESERNRDRKEVEMGLMKPYEYRMKWRGESEEVARAMTVPDQLS